MALNDLYYDNNYNMITVIYIFKIYPLSVSQFSILKVLFKHGNGLKITQRFVLIKAPISDVTTLV